MPQALRQCRAGISLRDGALFLLLSIVITSTAVAQAPPPSPSRPVPARPSPARAIPATSPAEAKAANEFAHFGVAVASPPPAPEWKRILEGSYGHVVRRARYGPNGKADALMSLELQRHESAEAFAATIAKRGGGQSAPVAGG